MIAFVSNFKKGRESARAEIAANPRAAGHASSAEDLAHIGLTAVYFVTAGILVIDLQFAHAICALAAGLIYASLYRHSRNHLKPSPHQSPR
jgi:hypothetical protein